MITFQHPLTSQGFPQIYVTQHIHPKGCQVSLFSQFPISVCSSALLAASLKGMPVSSGGAAAWLSYSLDLISNWIPKSLSRILNMSCHVQER